MFGQVVRGEIPVCPPTRIQVKWSEPLPDTGQMNGVPVDGAGTRPLVRRGVWIGLAAGLLALVGFILVIMHVQANVAAADSLAQQDLRVVLAAGKSQSGPTDHYVTELTALTFIEPAMTFVGAQTESSGPGDISVASASTPAGQYTFAVAARSDSGTCFYLKDTNTTGTTYGRGGTCTGAAALAGATKGSW